MAVALPGIDYEITGIFEILEVRGLLVDLYEWELDRKFTNVYLNGFLGSPDERADAYMLTLQLHHGCWRIVDVMLEYDAIEEPTIDFDLLE